MPKILCSSIPPFEFGMVRAKIEVRIGKLDRITYPDIMQIIGSLSFKEVSPLAH
jgi:hypothetical protein